MHHEVYCTSPDLSLVRPSYAIPIIIPYEIIILYTCIVIIFIDLSRAVLPTATAEYPMPSSPMAMDIKEDNMELLIISL